MKNLAILAVTLSVLSGSVLAESAVSESPRLTVALNSNSTWSHNEYAKSVNKSLDNQVSKTMEKVSVAMDKQLETKIAKEIEYAMQ